MRKNGNTNGKDRRPDPKPRKHPRLWQSCLMHDELIEMRKRHSNRISSIVAGKSNLDSWYEQQYLLDLELEKNLKQKLTDLLNFAAEVGPVWNWLTSIKGLKQGTMAAKLLALIDDITSFTNVSKLWRYAGYGVIDGKRERNKKRVGDEKGEKSHYNKILKSQVYLIVDEFIKQQTPVYVDIYYHEKARLRELHPVPEKGKGVWKEDFTDMHIHRMAMAKTGKIFLQHLWLVWRESEGLPINEPYAIAVLGHSDYLKPEVV